MSLREKLGKMEDQVAEMFEYVEKMHNPFAWLEALVKLPGLFVLQYVFYWNWKRIIDVNSWNVVFAGLAVWAIAIATCAVLIAQK